MRRTAATCFSVMVACTQLWPGRRSSWRRGPLCLPGGMSISSCVRSRADRGPHQQRLWQVPALGSQYDDIRSSALAWRQSDATRDWVEVLVRAGPSQPRAGSSPTQDELLSEHARRRGDPSPGAVKLRHQQERQGIPTLAIFAASAVFVFLVLAAQCESWKLPLAIVLIVPMCLLASATGLAFRGMPIDILAQIGFVVLVSGLGREKCDPYRGVRAATAGSGR